MVCTYHLPPPSGEKKEKQHPCNDQQARFILPGEPGPDPHALHSIWHRAFISSNSKQTPPNQKVTSEKKQLGRPRGMWSATNMGTPHQFGRWLL